MAAGAGVLVGALGGLAATHAGAMSNDAILISGAAELLVIAGCATGRSVLGMAAVALLVVQFVLVNSAALVLAPFYGGGMLLVGELVAIAARLRIVDAVLPGAVARVVGATVIACATTVAIAAVVAAIAGAHTGGSLVVTALGGLAAAASAATITALARARAPSRAPAARSGSAPPAGPTPPDAGPPDGPAPAALPA